MKGGESMAKKKKSSKKKYCEEKEALTPHA